MYLQFRQHVCVCVCMYLQFREPVFVCVCMYLQFKQFVFVCMHLQCRQPICVCVCMCHGLMDHSIVILNEPLHPGPEHFNPLQEGSVSRFLNRDAVD